MKTFWRKVFRWRTLLYVAAGVALLLALVVGALYTPWVRTFVLHKVEAYVRTHLNVELTAGSLRYDIFDLSASLGEVTLARPGSDLPPFFTADRISVAVPPALIFKGELRLRSFVIDRPRIDLAYGPGGTSNIPEFPKNPASPPLTRLPPLVLEKFALEDGTFLLRNPGARERVEIPGIAMTIRWTGGRHALRLEAGRPAVLEAGRIRLSLDALRLDGTFDRDNADIEALSVAFGESSVRLGGEVRDIVAPDLRMTVEADLRGPDLRRALGLGKDLEGGYELGAELSGPVKSLEAKGALRAAGLGYGAWTGADLRAGFRWAGGSLSVPEFSLTSPHGEISGRFEQKTGLGGAGGTLEAAWKSLDLALLSGAFGSPVLVGSLSDGEARAGWGAPLLSTLDARLDLTLAPLPGPGPKETGGKSPLAFSGRLRGGIRPPSPGSSGPSRVQAEGRLSGPGTGEFTLDATALVGGKMIDMASLGLTYAGGAVAVSGRLPLGPGGGPISLKVRGEDVDLAKTAAFFGRSLPAEGTLTFEASASGTRQSPDLSLRLDASGLTYGGRSLGAATLTGQSSAGRFGFELRLASFPLSAHGELGLAAPYDLSGKLDFDDLSLGSREPSAAGGGEDGLEGRLTGTVDFKAALAEMGHSVRAEAAFSRVSFGLPGRLLENRGPVRFSFDGRAFSVESLDLAGAGSDIRVSGALPLAPGASGGPLTIRATLDLSLADALKTGLAARGRLDLSSTVSGTLGSPVVALEAEVANGELRLKSVVTPVEALNLKLSVRDNVAGLESASFRWGEAEAEASGTFPLSVAAPSLLPAAGGRAFEVKGSVRNLDPAQAGKALSVPVLAGMPGAISFQFDAGGGSLDWKELAGSLRFSELRFRLGEVTFSESEPVRVALDRGRAGIESFRLAGEGTSFELAGGIDLAAGSFSGLALKGDLQLALLRPVLKTGMISGTSRLQVRLSGPLRSPEIDGALDLEGVDMRWPDYNLSMTGLTGTVGLEGQRMVIRDLRGELNQGRLQVGGSLDWRGLGLSGANLRVTAASVLTDYPQGFLAEWDLALGFTSEGGRQKLSGKASLIQGEYTENFNVRSELFGLLKGGGTRVYVERSPFLDKMTFDVDITTLNPFQIRNNLADVQVRAALKLSGTPYTPGLGGSVLVLDGGTIAFAGNTYQIEEGRVDFVNPNRIEPNLDLRATTTVSGYSITLNVTGTLANLQATFTSEPALPEADILSLLTVGVPLQGAAPASSTGLRDQALSYLESAVAGQVGKTIARGLGLDTLTLDTNLVAPGETPEARVTVGQHLTPNLEFIFSQDLRNSNLRTIILNYAPTRKLNFQGLNKDSNEYRFSVQGELRFGPSTAVPKRLSAAAATAGLKVGRIIVAGETGIPEKAVRKHFPLKSGRKFNFLAYDKALRKLKDYYLKSGRLDLKLRIDRETNDGRVDVTLNIAAGPRFEFRPQGFHLSKKLRKRLESRWMEETFAGMKLGDVEEAVRGEMCRERYFRAAAKARREEAGPDLARVVIEVDKGRRFRKPRVGFSGNTAFGDKALRKVLGTKDLCAKIVLDPGDSARTLRDYYREHGYLEAAVGKPEVQYGADGSVEAVFGIKEGALFRIGDIDFEGQTFFDRSRLLKAAGLASGEVFRLEKFDLSRTNILELYEANGFINAAVEARVKPDAAAAEVSLDYAVTENRRAFVEAVQLTGNRLTRTSFIRDVLAFEPGDVVNYRKINESRRNLYDLGIFRTLSLDLLKPPGADAVEAVEGGGAAERQPYLARLELAEARPVDLIGGFQYDTETSVGGNITIVHENFLGRALGLGGSALLDSKEQAGRVFIRSQYFLGGKADTNLSVFYNRTVEPDFTTRKYGVTLQQQRRYGDRYLLTYYYTLERDRTLSADASMDETDRIGRVSASLAYDSRNDFLNPTKGRFLYQTLEYGDTFLGSQFRYLRSFGQASFYFRLSPVFLLATAARLGVESGFGLDLPLSLRFFAGGSTTVRGYGFHELGPRDPETGAAVGGEAMLILNEELRFPIYKIVGGVVFLDLGNVYPSLASFRPLSLRSGAGFGLRLTLGALIGRFDMGFKLAPRPGESRYHLYFSIGQSF